MKDERVLIVRVKLNIDDEALRSLTDRLKKSFEDALKGTEFGKVAERFAKAVSGAGLDVSGFQKATKELARVGEELGGVPEVERLVSFLRKTERGFCR